MTSKRVLVLGFLLLSLCIEGLMLPLENHGVKCMSMGFFMKVLPVAQGWHHTACA